MKLATDISQKLVEAGKPGNIREVDVDNGNLAPVFSVVLGFRDWGLDRLKLSILSHLNSECGSITEVIVSDFGSKDPDSVRSLCESTGAHHVYTPSEIWSRSRALNAGICAARGKYIITSDADIIFSPTTLSVVKTYLDEFPDFIHFVQCADLTQQITPKDAVEFEWQRYKTSSTQRPRWGMGGLAAFTLEAFKVLRGFDERMVIWGAEDQDFGDRFVSLGLSQNWIVDDAASIYHLWHEPSAKPGTAAFTAAEQNRRYRNESKNIIRNLSSPYLSKLTTKLVSIVICTKNRKELLEQSIYSALNQTFEDIEVIVVDDGSSDDTAKLLKSIKDKRFRFITLDAPKGIPVARNIGNTAAEGYFVAVHDDDDLMLPDRIELQLNSISTGSAGSYGGWVDFSELNKTLGVHSGKTPLEYYTLLFHGSAIVHATLLIRRDILLRYPYEDKFLGGSDYNLICRLLRDGIRLEHCGNVVLLRRLHDGNITFTGTGTQKGSGKMTASAAMSIIPPSVEAKLRENAKAVTFAEVDSWNAPRVMRNLPGVFIRSSGTVPFSLESLSKFISDKACSFGFSYSIADGRLQARDIFILGSGTFFDYGGQVGSRDLLTIDPAVRVELNGNVVQNASATEEKANENFDYLERNIGHEGGGDIYNGREIYVTRFNAESLVFLITNEEQFSEGESGAFLVTHGECEWRFSGLTAANSWLRSRLIRRISIGQE